MLHQSMKRRQPVMSNEVFYYIVFPKSFYGGKAKAKVYKSEESANKYCNENQYVLKIAVDANEA